MRCDVGMTAANLSGCDDDITQPLTIQIAGHMNHDSVGQFEPQAAARIRDNAPQRTVTRRRIPNRDRYELR